MTNDQWSINIVRKFISFTYTSEQVDWSISIIYTTSIAVWSGLIGFCSYRIIFSRKKWTYKQWINFEHVPCIQIILWVQTTSVSSKSLNSAAILDRIHLCFNAEIYCCLLKFMMFENVECLKAAFNVLFMN